MSAPALLQQPAAPVDPDAPGGATANAATAGPDAPAAPAAPVRERCLTFDCEGESLLGVLSEPPAPDGGIDTGVLIVVGGPQYRAGAHRQFTLLARVLATAGFPVLRFDVRGMGDSTGAQRSFETLGADVRAGVQALLQARAGLQRVVLWGLCDGASAALLALQPQPHPAVAGLCLLNPWVRSEASLAQAQVQHYYRQRLMQADFWRKLLRGGVAKQAARDLLHNLRAARAARGDTLASGLAPRSFQQRMALAWQGFQGPVLLLLSERDTTAQEFTAFTRGDALWQAALQARVPERVTLAGADHTCSSPAAQAAAEQATLAWLQRHFAACAGRPAQAATGRAAEAGLMVREHTAGPSGPPPIPRLPVFGWQALRGAREAATPCLLELPGLHYTTSGRAAILLALQTLGLGPRDAVLLPSYHCPTMVAPARHLGAQVRFYPIDALGTPRLDWLAQQDLQGVRVLLAAHFFGLPQPMAPVRAWCNQRGIVLIEDCAHALFGRSGGQAIGSWGDMAIASLTKFLPVPEGGCLVVNPGAPQAGGNALPPLNACSLGSQLHAATDILELGAAHRRLAGLNGLVSGVLAAMRALRPRSAPDEPTGQPGGDKPTPLPPAGALSAGEQQIDSTLAHRRLSAASRWVGRAMPRARIVERRRAHYAWLAQRLAGHRGLRPLLPDLPPDCAPYVFPLWTDTPDPGYAELRQLRMPVFRWDRLWPGVPELPGDHGLRWSHHVLQLACHQDLQADDLERFAQALLRLYAR